MDVSLSTVCKDVSNKPDQPGIDRVQGVQEPPLCADDRAIRLRHLRDRFLPATSSTNLPQGRRVSDRTIRRRLRAANLRPRRPYRGPFLTQRHRQERLRWCNARLRWRLNVEWSNVLFSDESRFSLYHSDGRARVYRRTGERGSDTLTAVCDNMTDVWEVA